MHLYLSSYHFGSQVDQFVQSFASKKVALISNALDFSDDLERRAQSASKHLESLHALGLEPEELDLRSYFGHTEQLKEKLSALGGVWVRGGNTFILRRAMAQSGFDMLLHKLKSTNFVYGGYSAGACVMTPTLRGIHLVDEPEASAAGYAPGIIWDGLGFVPYCIAPHYRSNHPESELIEKSVAYFQEHHLPFVTLHDGEDIVEEVKGTS